MSLDSLNGFIFACKTKFCLSLIQYLYMSTRSKYNRVRPQQEKREEKPDTDILMRFSERYGKYVSRALTLFFGEDKTFVTIKAAERLIDRALWVAEVVRRKVPDLHQIITISEKKTVDVYEPKEEGLLEVRQERFLTIVEITLTKAPTAEEKNAPGYHTPLKEGTFLTKQSWKKGEEQRAAKRGDRNESRGEDRPRRNDRSGDDRRGDDRREGRGGQRRRGGNRRE